MASTTLLIVDDNVIVRQAAASFAEVIGFEVVEAGTLDDARIHLTGKIDYLLCDDDLGEPLSGLEFISSHPELMPTVVVLMSGNTKPLNLPDGIRYLSKPFTINQLKNELMR